MTTSTVITVCKQLNAKKHVHLKKYVININEYDAQLGDEDPACSGLAPFHHHRPPPDWKGGHGVGPPEIRL